MIFSKNEHVAIMAIIIELEKTAQSQPDHSSTRAALYRHAADLKRMISKAVISRNGRADGQPC